MTQEDFKNYIENISALERFKKNISTLKIEWETDASKIDLSVLPFEQEFHNIPGTRFLIEWVPTERIQSGSYIFVDGTIDRFVQLYRLIETGTKIIPPLSRRPVTFIDGKAQDIEQSPMLGFQDGGHRIAIAKYLNLKEIPVLFVETPDKISFSKENWDLNCIGETLEFTSKNTGEKQSFPLANCHLTFTVSGDFMLFVN